MCLYMWSMEIVRHFFIGRAIALPDSFQDKKFNTKLHAAATAFILKLAITDTLQHCKINIAG